jgi:hypothetical protein
MSFMTAQPDPDQMSYTKGHPVGIITIEGADYLRVDAEPIAADELGELPEF